ncbi:MAG: phosphomannose isomerase type II C-terminal cupin domain [Actinomycetota bacterium]|nr:phosphomannose isomerase type II C-terminal cupin domain [Actinomycetota bacterium]
MLENKPWGNYKQLALNQTCSVKIITLNSGQETSLHFHNLRDDMWVILDDGISVQIGDKIYETKPGDEFVIPAEEKHRIISQADKARVLEIAFGYTNEDDTHRLADDYGRKLEEMELELTRFS